MADAGVAVTGAVAVEASAGGVFVSDFLSPLPNVMVTSFPPIFTRCLMVMKATVRAAATPRTMGMALELLLEAGITKFKILSFEYSIVPDILPFTPICI